jgi:hypothetical protein
MPSAPSSTPAAARRPLVLAAVLRLLRPLVRLLLQSGVSYRAFSVELKRVFVEAAQHEAAARGMAATDSALTLLSGVHRKDVRALLREEPATAVGLTKPAGLASEVVARWLADRRWRQRNGRLRTLPRGTPGAGGETFDALVESVSRDVRPRALLDELLRLGVAHERDDGSIELLRESFIPREGFAEIAALFADNLHDHAAAAAENVHGGHNHLEQSVYVDEITTASAAQLQRISVQAWKQAFRTVMTEAQQRFDDDTQHAAPAERNQRARFGVYFYSTTMDETAGPT